MSVIKNWAERLVIESKITQKINPDQYINIYIYDLLGYFRLYYYYYFQRKLLFGDDKRKV